MFKNKLKGFTLAEVLIAMTIVGVVAALTVPALTSDTQAKSNKLKARKAYATLTTAFDAGMSIADYRVGEISSFKGQAPSLDDILGRTLKYKSTTRNRVSIKGYLPVSNCGAAHSADYVYNKTLQWCEKLGTGNVDALKMGDGAEILFIPKTNLDTTGCTLQSPCLALLDINGAKEPNTVIMCTGGEDDRGWDKDTNDNYTNAPAACSVKDNAITDIYPLIIFEDTVEPATGAAAAILEDS